MRIPSGWRVACAFLFVAWGGPSFSAEVREIIVVPNFHPASCGWLADFSRERNYCANSYLAHLDRVREDASYAFALSEVNNLIAILAFAPGRAEELRERIREGRVELVNGFFLEPTVNISGGEALVKQGIEGLRWQEAVFGVRPRFAWMIDVTGVHEQMAQIAAGLGLEGIVYTRDNPTGKTLHWLESPDGTRALAISPGSYAEWSEVFSSTDPLGRAELEKLLADARSKAERAPAGFPVLVLAGSGDYSLPPARKEYPSEFLESWRRFAPDVKLRFATPSRYLDAVLPAIRSGEIELPVSRSGAKLSWSSFWIQNPRVKSWFRRAEHALGAAEAFAAVASLERGCAYPVKELYYSWLELLLCMDRNTLWGAAAGKVFESKRSWDARDRLESVEKNSSRILAEALRAALGPGESIALANALPWSRSDPALLELPAGTRPAGIPSQSQPGGRALFRPELPPFGAASLELEAGLPSEPSAVDLPPAIATRHYEARLDPKSGALRSLKLPCGREVLGGAVLVVAESGGDPHFTPPRPKRKRLGDSASGPVEISVRRGPVATVVEARGGFYGGGRLRQEIRFYADHPRIDFEVELSDVANGTLALVEVPFASEVREVRRGIPCGFSAGAWGREDPELPGWTDGIQAAVRWSQYALSDGCGLAILDRGLPGRELSGRTAVLFLLAAQDSYLGYPCAWLSGRGTHCFSFALLAHEGDWKEAGIPRSAWEFNSPPTLVRGVARSKVLSFVETSSNLILEALRREGSELELRAVECLGLKGSAEVRVSLPHVSASRTDLLGRRAASLGAGPRYRFPVRPQEIITLRLRTLEAVEPVEALKAWDPLVPKGKLVALRRHLPGCVGHPPMGPGIPAEELPELPGDAEASLSLGKTATASNVYRGMAAYSAGMAVDGDETTRWATDGEVDRASLEVDLGRAETIGRAWLAEAYDRVREFEIQVFRAGRWESVAKGGKIRKGLELEFAPVAAEKVRLEIVDAPGGPTIWEFLLFPPRRP